jgi:hypothetical protein
MPDELRLATFGRGGATICPKDRGQKATISFKRKRFLAESDYFAVFWCDQIISLRGRWQPEGLTEGYRRLG